MQFEKNTSYDFTFDHFVEHKGTRYLQLTYEGKTSMPEYKEEGWLFWVKAESFQNDLTDDDLEGQTIRCFVTGYMNDDLGNFPTTFPKLVQDKGWLLAGFYQIGESYTFTISQIPGDLRHTRIKETGEYQDVPIPEGTYYVLDSQYSYEHQFKSKKKYERNESIELIVKKIGKQWLELQNPPQKEVIFEGVPQLEDQNDSPREDSQLEYKSSFVFPPAQDRGERGEPNIDLQLDKTIMKEIASFMNASGGILWIGRRDDGSVCGINEDIPHLNESTQDEFTYQLNMDGVELKIRNRANFHLGSFAETLISDIGFSEKNGLYVLKLTIQPSPQPVFYDNLKFYCRSGNSCRHLVGLNLWSYCSMHFKETPTQLIEKDTGNSSTAPIESLEPIPPEMRKVIVSPLNPPQTSKSRSKFITFYKDCSASCGSKPVDDKDTDFSLELAHEYCNAKSRLLLCYDNGHVNILKINEVLEQLGGRNKRYANRLNKEQNLLPFKFLIAHSEDYLLIRSRMRTDGTKMIKLVAVENYTGHTNMATKGNKLVDAAVAEIYDMKVVASKDLDRYNEYFTKRKDSSPGVIDRN